MANPQNPYASLYQQPAFPAYGAPTGMTQPAAPAGGGQQGWLSNPYVQSALVSGGIGLAGGLISGAGQSKQNEQNNAASAEQAALNRQLELYLAQMNQKQRQAEVGLQTATQAPSRQDWRQRQAMMADILPGLRNASVTPPGDLGRFTPQISGGLRLPEGGFSPEALSFFSPQARVSAEADLDRAGQAASGGQMPTPNYASAGYGPAGAGPAQGVTDYAAQLRQQTQQQGMDQAVNRLTQTQTQQQRQPAIQQQQGPSTGQRLGQAALMAGLAYAGNRWGGGGEGGGGQQQQQSPWMQMALAAAGGYFGGR